MKNITKRADRPVLSGAGEQVFTQYERRLLVEDDLTAVTTRNYLSDLRYFTTWCESILKKGRKEKYSFAPETVITTRITGCQINLQQELHLKPIPVNRKLISFKRYFVWQHTRDQIKYAPTKVMKLIVKVVFSPRHLDDQEEQRLIAIVMETGNLRGRSIFVLILDRGLRIRELLTLTCAQVRLGNRSGIINVRGNYHKYREILLNATVRVALLVYDLSLQKPQSIATPLLLSEKRQTQLIEYGLSNVIKKYANRDKVSYLSPHDLRYHFGCRLTVSVPLHRLAQLMGYDSLGTNMLYIRGTMQDLPIDVEKIAWR